MARTEQVTINSVTYTCEKRNCAGEFVFPVTGAAMKENRFTAVEEANRAAAGAGWAAWRSGSQTRYYCPAHEPASRGGMDGPRLMW